MADLRSGSSSSNSSSSSKTSDDIFKRLRSRVVLASKPPRPSYFDNRLGWKWKKVKKNKGDPPNPAITEALNFYNLTSVPQYRLLKPGSITPVGLAKCRLYHVNFTAKKIGVADAPKERFFAEVTRPATTMLLSVKLCISLGPIKSLSGDRLNGCFCCRDYNNVWHPKDGGFVRGAEGLYKTLQDICDNPIPDEQKHFPMLKQVSQACEPKKECEYPSEQVDDDTSPHATEALKFYNHTTNRSYELVKPGFATRVILRTCFLFHVNFKAKETDPTALAELFFAELTSTDGVFSCKGCRILTKADLTQGNFTGDKTNGCYYCHDFNNVRHPQAGRFVRGGDSLYKPEKGFE